MIQSSPAVLKRGMRARLWDLLFLGFFALYTTAAIVWLSLGLTPALARAFPPLHEALHTWGSGTQVSRIEASDWTGAFRQKELSFQAGVPVIIEFENRVRGVPHNVAIYRDASAEEAIFRGAVLDGPAPGENEPTRSLYGFTAPAAGTYFFRCDVHPDMHGPVTVVSAEPVDPPALAGLAKNIADQSHGAEPPGQAALQYLFSVVNLVLGALLLWLRPRDRVARLLAVGMVGTAAVFNLQAHQDLDVLSALGYTPHTSLHLISGIAYVFALVLFPDGKLVPGWSEPNWYRWPIRVLYLLFLVLIGLMAFFNHGEPEGFVFFFGVLIPIAGISSQAFRYRNAATAEERQLSRALMWTLGLAFGAALLLALFALALSAIGPSPAGRALGELGQIVFLVFPPLFGVMPVAFFVLLIRYRVWDIERVLNRALVYGVLTACVIGLYVLVVGSLSVLFQTGGNPAIALTATGLVAVLFEPLRTRLQRAVNRLMYGERDEPYAVLSRLGRRLEGTLAPEAVLPTIVRTVTEALRLPYAAIALRTGDGLAPGHFPKGEGELWSGSSLATVAEGEGTPSPAVPPSRRGKGARGSGPSSVIAASGGSPVPDPLRLPLVYQNEPVGELLVGPRAPGEAFSPADRRLLADLAHQAGVAAHAVRLTAELQRSRQRLVTAREEERRRLRRDLHDGLGPALASLTLKLETARNRLGHDPGADALLAELAAQVQDAIADIRRLVYALRPPALDELGLVSALREQAAQYGQSGHNALHITVEAPECLPPLPAAVEVAAYRIGQEALTNVVRHADARTCRLALSLAVNGEQGTLRIEVSDDGRGPGPDRALGVGLPSMRERAAELGGACLIEPLPAGGTRVFAELPLPQ